MNRLRLAEEAKQVATGKP